MRWMRGDPAGARRGWQGVAKRLRVYQSPRRSFKGDVRVKTPEITDRHGRARYDASGSSELVDPALGVRISELVLAETAVLVHAHGKRGPQPPRAVSAASQRRGRGPAVCNRLVAQSRAGSPRAPHSGHRSGRADEMIRSRRCDQGSCRPLVGCAKRTSFWNDSLTLPSGRLSLLPTAAGLERFRARRQWRLLSRSFQLSLHRRRRRLAPHELNERSLAFICCLDDPAILAGSRCHCSHSPAD